MKHQTPQLPKFKKLKRRLGLTRDREVVGLLETLWIVTQTAAPRGNIGKLDNEEIAIELEWDDDPELLVDALVETGWLDRSEQHRLVVHDWAEHAPRWVHAVAKRKGGIILGQSATTVADYSSQRDALQSATTVADCSGQQPNLTKPNQETPLPPLASKGGGDGGDFAADGEAPEDPEPPGAADGFQPVKVRLSPLLAVSERFGETWRRWQAHCWTLGSRSDRRDFAQLMAAHAVSLVGWAADRGVPAAVWSLEEAMEQRWRQPANPSERFPKARSKARDPTQLEIESARRRLIKAGVEAARDATPEQVMDLHNQQVLQEASK